MTPFSGSIVLLAPHPDDAALSCGALLERGEPIDVLTVFTGVPHPPRRGRWDERCGFADSEEGRRVRCAEELEGLSPGGHRVRFLDVLDSQYLDGPRPDADARAIGSALGDFEGALVAAPVGAGRRPRWFDRALRRVAPRGSTDAPHPDHVFVRDAVLDVVEGPVLLYEEFPYLRSGPGDQAATKLAEARGVRAELWIAEVDRSAKARRIAAYASQLPHAGRPEKRFDRPELLRPVERYWLLA